MAHIGQNFQEQDIKLKVNSLAQFVTDILYFEVEVNSSFQSLQLHFVLSYLFLREKRRRNWKFFEEKPKIFEIRLKSNSSG